MSVRRQSQILFDRLLKKHQRCWALRQPEGIEGAGRIREEIDNKIIEMVKVGAMLFLVTLRIYR